VGSFSSALDDDRSTDGSVGSFGANGTGSRKPSNGSDDGSVYSNPGTPRAYSSGGSGGYNSNYNDYGDKEQTDEWIEISRDQLYVPNGDDLGRKLKLEAAAYSSDTGELLMLRVVKTDLVLARAPDPIKRKLVTAKTAGASGGARFRIATYNVLAEIYATQQQYPYCDFWALSWDYRCVNKTKLAYFNLIISNIASQLSEYSEGNCRRVSGYCLLTGNSSGSLRESFLCLHERAGLRRSLQAEDETVDGFGWEG
jgi:hypothetical protein